MKEKFDLVLIDDDDLIHLMWKFMSNQKQLKLLALTDFNSADFNHLQPDTPIFIDKNLSGKSGLEVAKHLNTLGFKKLFIASGEDLELNDMPEFISGVQGKDFPQMVNCSSQNC